MNRSELLFRAHKIIFTIALAAIAWLAANSAVQAAPSFVPVWTARYNGPAHGTDKAKVMAADGAGHVFVAGYSVYASETVAYSSAGVALWTNRFDDPGNGNTINAIAVGGGNVYVTGYAPGTGASTDRNIRTVAYSIAGQPLWTNLYYGPVSGGGQGSAVAVAPGGEVYVSGYSISGGYNGFVTIAFSSAGIPLWTNRYDQTGNSFVAAVAVDGDANVVVTGQAADSSFGFDFATIAYSSAGVPLWTNRYDTGGNFGYDTPAAVAIDASHTVYVTGSAAGGNLGVATIAYTMAGQALWTNLFFEAPNGGNGTSVVLGNGNIYVAGSSLGTNSYPAYDYFAIALNSSGTRIWTNHYNGTGRGRDTLAGAAADASGKLYVSGYSLGTNGSSDYDYATVAYSSAGSALWTNRFTGATNSDDEAKGIVAADGNVYVTGYGAVAGGGFDYATFAYSSSGARVWTNRYTGPGAGEDAATASVVGPSGNLYVTGYSIGTHGPSDYDCTTIAYSTMGVPLWTNRYNGPANNDDAGVGIALDSSENVYVAGYTVTTNGSYDFDYLTLAYSSAGVPLWTNRYNGPGNDHDSATSIAVRNGRVYVTGYSMGTVSSHPASATNFDYATIAYSTAGAPLWTNRYNGAANGADEANAIAVDSSGNAYVTGFSLGSHATVDYDYDFVTIAYSAAGARLWTNRYNGPGSDYDSAAAIAVDDAGHVFVGGYSMNNDAPSHPASTAYYDFATVAYATATGAPLWTNRYDGTGNNDDGVTAIAVKGGNVYVTGDSYGPNGYKDYDYATIAYTSAGAGLWTNRYNGPANNDDNPNSIAISSDGNIYVTGYSLGTNNSSDYDYATVAYSSDGVALWTNRYAGPMNGDDGAEAVAVDGAGSVFVTGYSAGTGTGFDYLTVKYALSGTSPVPLNYQVSGGKLVLSWTDPAFKLQTAPLVTGTYTNVPNSSSPFTNDFSRSQQYFRLSLP